MIPKTDVDLTPDFKTAVYPSKTYYINTASGRITGKVDGLESVRQAVYLILNTERYQYPIYSWNYGAELNSLYGQPSGIIYPEIERSITEALLQDDRISAVDSFTFAKKKGAVSVSFSVHTIYGDIKAEKEVIVGV